MKTRLDDAINEKNSAGHSKLMLAVRAGDFGLTKHYLKRGANPQCSDDNGDTVLMVAAAQGNQKILRLLLSFGADLSAHDGRGLSAFDHARLNGHLETAKYLKSRMAHPRTSRLTELFYSVHALQFWHRDRKSSL